MIGVRGVFDRRWGEMDASDLWKSYDCMRMIGTMFDENFQISKKHL